MRAPGVLLFLYIVLLSGTACAHEIRPAYLHIEERAPDRFDVTWKQPSKGSVMLYLEPAMSNGLLDTAPDAQYSTESFVIRQWRDRHLARASFDGAIVRIEGLQKTLTDALVNISFADGQQITALLKPEEPSLTIGMAAKPRLAISAYLMLGIEHILTGFDHLSFVLGLIMLVRAGQLVATISAFTLAHSITLTFAAMGRMNFDVPFIEALVALSIVFTAIEMVRLWRGRSGIMTQHPWLISFAFGLLHGFAFAGSLADIGLPNHNIPVALLLFNCGVEVGQLMFVGAALGLVALLQRYRLTAWDSYARWSIAYAIGAVASYWTIERINILLG